MAVLAPPRWAASRPHLFLAGVFVLYKAFILLITAGTLAFADYDTSTDRFVELAGVSAPGLARKLLRWDAVYFVHTAREGYVYEQEWAFGMGFSSAVRMAVYGARMFGVGVGELVMAVVLAHAAHLAAVMALHHLTLALLSSASSSASTPSELVKLRTRSMLPALLHIISPAGIFLSAPYAESSFAALSLVGVLLFARAGRWPSGSLLRTLHVVGAGVVFGVSALFRSNGILSGLLFLVEAVYGLLVWRRDGKWLAWRCIVDVAALCVGGLALAAGFAYPQIVAWERYCRGGETGARPAWCEAMPPSIYTHVQSKYWNVGFLRYWTPNQIPLFALAAPMLALLIGSGLFLLRDPASFFTSSQPDQKTPTKPAEDGLLRAQRIIRTLAAAQALLAVLALTSYHVQIINRISSGYAPWYWWTAAAFQGNEAGRQLGGVWRRRRGLGRLVVVGSVVYGALQAALFASFMPPA